MRSVLYLMFDKGINILGKKAASRRVLLIRTHP